MSDHEISLPTSEKGAMIFRKSDSPGLADVLADVFRPIMHLQPGIGSQLDVLFLGAERWEEHTVWSTMSATGSHTAIIPEPYPR